jgi:hypothetical protein
MRFFTHTSTIAATDDADRDTLMAQPFTERNENRRFTRAANCQTTNHPHLCALLRHPFT